MTRTSGRVLVMSGKKGMVNKGMFKAVPAMERYLSKRAPQGTDPAHPTCRPWTGRCKSNGLPYGQFSDENRKNVIAHRWGYKHLVGPIPEGLEVRHTCDNPPCQEETHWLLGTRQDNVDDCTSRERQARGSRAGRSKLTEDDVRVIRQMLAVGENQVVIAEMFGVSNPSIAAIASGQSWGWLLGGGQGPVGYPTGAKNKLTVLTEDDVRAIRKLLAAGELQRYVAAKFKVGNNTISAIATGKTWGWLK